MGRDGPDGPRMDRPGLADEAKREHRVPLGRRAVNVLDAPRTLGGGSPLVVADGRTAPARVGASPASTASTARRSTSAGSSRTW